MPWTALQLEKPLGTFKSTVKLLSPKESFQTYIHVIACNMSRLEHPRSLGICSVPRD